MLSHKQQNQTIEQTIEQLKQKIRQVGNKPHVTVEEQLHIVDELAQFPLGKFWLQNRGTDGYWTDYMIQHQYQGRMTGIDPQGRELTAFEKAFLDKIPFVVATQQRATHFTKVIQSQVKEGAVLGSLPCGLMRDLLSLDFSGIKDFQLVGMDIDPQSLELAQKLAENYELSNRVQFYQVDAWKQPFQEHFTLLASNGLNVYEPNDEKIVELYRQLFKALVPGGVLVTSVITSPPNLDPDSAWDFSQIDAEAMRLQNILFSDILNFDFKGLRSASTTQSQLQIAGFEEIEVIGDAARVFPTLVVRKPA